MTLFSRVRSFLTTLIWRERFEDELDEELRFHLEAHTEDLVRAGVPRAEAERRARAHFGSFELAKDASRLARGLRLADELERDLRLAARVLMKARWHTLGAACVLALAIGTATAMFTVVNAVLLRGLPVDDERIVHLGTRDADGREAGVSLPDLQDWEDGARTFDEMAAYLTSGVNVADDEEYPVLLPASYVSADLFRLLNAEPAIGGMFDQMEELPGGPRVVVLGHELWQDRYDGDPAILGRTIRVDSRPAVVIGVMPDGFEFPLVTDLWLPLGFQELPTGPRDARTHRAIGRLEEEFTIDEAREDIEAIADRLAEEHPETNQGVWPFVERYSKRAVAPQRGRLLIPMAAVGLVLLIACANVGGLLLARVARRSGEVTLRSALGASRGRILRQLLVESTLLAAAGCLLGVAVASVAVRFFGAQLDRCELGCLPYWIEWTADMRVLVFMGLTGLAAGLFCGIVPALHACSYDPDDAGRRTGPTGRGARLARHGTSGLLATEIALTLVLLVGTGLTARSFTALQGATGVVNGEGVLTFSMLFRDSDSRDDRGALLRELEERLSAMPELDAATLASMPPFGGGFGRWLEIDGRPPGDALPGVTYVTIADDYFETLGLRLLAGRPFRPQDGEPGREHAIVNQRFVDSYFPGENPLDRRLRLSDGNGTTEPGPWMTIVGVSPNVPQRRLDLDEGEPVVYFPVRGDPPRGAYGMVRPRVDAGSVMSRIREEWAQADSELALFNVMPLEEAMARSRRQQRFLLTMLGLFAGLGLMLASVGAYSVAAYEAARRIRELGIRMALGAPRLGVVRYCLRRSMAPVMIGLALGATAAWIAVRALSGLLVATDPTDYLTLLLSAAILVAIVLAACLVSARQAASVDPVSVLRTT